MFADARVPFPTMGRDAAPALGAGCCPPCLEEAGSWGLGPALLFAARGGESGSLCHCSKVLGHDPPNLKSIPELSGDVSDVSGVLILIAIDF